MNKHSKMFRFLSVCIVIVIFCFILINISNLTKRKAGVEKYADFYGQEENFDVLFLGSSHMLNGVFPMELWSDYGIISYNFGGHSNKMPLNYWQLINALDYTNPKLVVLDCAFLHSKYKVDPGSNYPHISLDEIPLSYNKIKAVMDLFDDNDLRLEYLFPFSKYHNRWTNIIKEDVEININVQKGAEARVNVAEPEQFDKIAEDDVLSEETVNVEYLRKIIQLCEEKNIEILLVYIPYPAGASGQRDAKFVHQIAEEYNVNYIDFLSMDGVVNYQTDCCDAKSHLNPSGARKVTDYLGQYIMNNYDIEDHRTDTEYNFWNDDYDEYIDYKLELFRKETDLKNYLMLMNDDDFDYVIEIQNSELLLSDEVLIALLENIYVDSTKLQYNQPLTIRISNSDIVYANGVDDMKEAYLRITITDSADGNILDIVEFDSESGELTHIQ